MCLPYGSVLIVLGNIAFIAISIAIFGIGMDMEVDNPWILFSVINLLLNTGSAVLLVMLLCNKDSLKLRLANAIYSAIMSLHVLNVGIGAYMLFELFNQLTCSEASGIYLDNCLKDGRKTSFTVSIVVVVIGLIIQGLIFW